MNPHKMNKVDISAMSAEDQKAFKMYGKSPAKNVLTKMQKDRKYFDSGDYMMNKAGVNTNQPLGTAIPTPEGVPHASPPGTGPTSPPPNLSSSPTGQVPSPAAILGQNREGSPTDRFGHQGNGHHANNVGMGISPAATSEAMEVPPAHHHRRTSESNHGARISPPGTLRDFHNPSSSFPIQHAAGFGSSPVKASTLGKRLDEEMDG